MHFDDCRINDHDMLKFRGLGIAYCYAAFSNIAAAARLDITVAV